MAAAPLCKTSSCDGASCSWWLAPGGECSFNVSLGAADGCFGWRCANQSSDCAEKTFMLYYSVASSLTI